MPPTATKPSFNITDPITRMHMTNRAIRLLKVLTQMRRDNPELFSEVKDYVQAAKQQNSEATKCP